MREDDVRVNGQVVDRDGLGVAWAVVAARELPRPGCSDGALIDSTLCDDSGRFELRVPRSQCVVVIARFTRDSVSARVSDGVPDFWRDAVARLPIVPRELRASPLLMRLRLPALVSGIVRSDSATPLDEMFVGFGRVDAYGRAAMETRRGTPVSESGEFDLGDRKSVV